jgi:dihydrofolate reductase
MRKIIVFENITLNGMMAGPKGELDWAIQDAEVTDYTREGGDTIDTFVFGRVTYDMMAMFWPTPAGKSANPVFANALNKAQKIVFSRTLKKAEWQPTEVIPEIDKEKVIKEKERPFKDIMIFGSRSIVSQLTRLGLIDEYQLMVNPIILGKGLPLFDETLGKVNLKLVRSRAFKSGLELLVYQPINK